MTSRVGVARKGLEQNSVFEIRVVSAGQVCSCLPRPALHLAPSVGEQCKQCKEGHGRVVERSATPGTSSEIPLRSPTHTHSTTSSTPADALTARKGKILQQPIYGGSKRPALPIFLFRGSFFLHIRTPILQQLELTFARMGLQNDLRDTRGANLF